MEVANPILAAFAHQARCIDLSADRDVSARCGLQRVQVMSQPINGPMSYPHFDTHTPSYIVANVRQPESIATILLRGAWLSRRSSIGRGTQRYKCPSQVNCNDESYSRRPGSDSLDRNGARPKIVGKKTPGDL